MRTELQEHSTDVAAWEESPTSSPYLSRVLDEVERAIALREEPPSRPTPATVRTPRLFAHD